MTKTEDDYQKTINRMKNHNRQQGFSLIEVLVSLLIMAIGALGVAGLQVISLQQNRDALYRAEANQLANDILDRIRVNSDQDYSVLISDAPVDTTSCMGADCTPAEMAAFDIAQWKCAIRSADLAGDEYAACTTLNDSVPVGSPSLITTGTLPMGAGGITLAGNVYTVEVRWSDDRVNILCGLRDGSADEPLCNSVTLETRL